MVREMERNTKEALRLFRRSGGMCEKCDFPIGKVEAKVECERALNNGKVSEGTNAIIQTIGIDTSKPFWVIEKGMFLCFRCAEKLFHKNT